MKLYHLFKQDIKYQFKYGFHLAYFLITIFYIVILKILPESMVKPLLIVIIFSDPAALGFFFMGGILLLEQDERLQNYNAVLPVSQHLYIISKVASLSLIATVVAVLITFSTFLDGINYLLLILATFLGAAVYTLMGLSVATLAKSLNHYFIKSLPVAILLIAPAVLVLFNMTHFVIEILPAVLLIRLLESSIDNTSRNFVILRAMGLSIWSVIAYLIAYAHYKKYLSQGEG